MVTIDKIVQSMGTFSGNVKNHRAYERAKTNIETIDNDEGMQKLEETLRKETGYNDVNLPIEPDTYSITRGNITFSVKSEKTTKRPQYKKAVEQMENYIKGINTLLLEGEIITGVAKENETWCVSVNSLLDVYKATIAGVRSPGVRQTITYEADESLMKIPKRMDMSVSNDGNLNSENFIDYIQRDLLRVESRKYSKAYEKELKNQVKLGKIIPVNTRKGYKEETTKSEGVDWGYVAKTLVNNDLKSPGELNILADVQIPIEDRIIMMPQYQLFIRTPNDADNQGRPKLYVGIQSVYNRIQALKEGKTIVAEKTTYTPKEIV